MFENLLIILEQSLILLPLILGAYLSMSLMKVPNLGIESAFVFGAIVGYQSLSYAPEAGLLSLIISLLASSLGGMFVGIITSIITMKLKLSNLLSAIVTIGLFNGISQYVLGSSHAAVTINNLGIIPSIHRFPALSNLLILAIFIFLLFFIFIKTKLGVSCAIYGNNPKFFKKYNISSYFIFFIGMALSGALAGISGYLVTQTNGFVDISMSLGISLFCITVLMMGQALVKTYKPITCIVPLIGIVAYFSLQQLLLKLGFDLRYFNIIQALVILTKVIILQKGLKENQNQLGI